MASGATIDQRSQFIGNVSKGGDAPYAVKAMAVLALDKEQAAIAAEGAPLPNGQE